MKYKYVLGNEQEKLLFKQGKTIVEQVKSEIQQLSINVKYKHV